MRFRYCISAQLLCTMGVLYYTPLSLPVAYFYALVSFVIGGIYIYNDIKGKS